MNENRLNFPEIQDAHLDQMIRLAFAQEAALLAQEWMAQSETPETPQEQERAERLLRRMWRRLTGRNALCGAEAGAPACGGSCRGL